MSTETQDPIFVRIRFKYPDVDTFVDQYASNVSQGGIFVPSRSPEPVDTVLNFELTLSNNTPFLYGQGRVVWIKAYDETIPNQPHGMGIRFIHLDDASQKIIDRVLAFKREHSPRRHRKQNFSTPTQELHALAKHIKPIETTEHNPHNDSKDPMLEIVSHKKPANQSYNHNLSPAQIARLVLEKQHAFLQKNEAQSSQAQALAAALDSAGDDTSVMLAVADQILQDILQSTQLSQDKVNAVFAQTISSPIDEQDLAESTQVTKIPRFEEDIKTQLDDDSEVIPVDSSIIEEEDLILMPNNAVPLPPPPPKDSGSLSTKEESAEQEEQTDEASPKGGFFRRLFGREKK